MRRTSVHRAKWMNDRRPSVPVDLGKCSAYQKTSGSHSRPSHLTELKTVIAIACPSTLRGVEPVAVIGSAGLGPPSLMFGNLISGIDEVKRHVDDGPASIR